MKNQAILDLGQEILKYCIECRIFYNSTNKNDLQLHKRLHKKQRLPRKGRVSEYFYVNKNKCFFGSKFVEASCSVKIKDGLVLIKDLVYENENSKNELVEFVNKYFSIQNK